MLGIASFLEMPSDEDENLVTVLTCEGNLTDPDFPFKLSSLVARLKNLLSSGDKPITVTNVEPWNSVRVTFTIPREAAQRLRHLAQHGDRALRDLGILSVQIEGDQVISLTIAGRFSEPQEIILRPSTSTDDTRSATSISSQSGELDTGSSVQSNVETTRKNIAQYLTQQGGGGGGGGSGALALGSVISAMATTSSSSASSLSLSTPSTSAVLVAGDFKSPNVVAPGSEPIPFPPKGIVSQSPGRVTSNLGPFPFASMTYAMNTMHGSASSTVSSSSASSAYSASSSSSSSTAVSPSTSTSAAPVVSPSSRFPFSPPPPPYPGTSSQVVVPGAFKPVRSLVPQATSVINNLPKKKVIGVKANAALASPLLVNLLQSDVGTSPPSQPALQGFKVFPSPNTESPSTHAASSAKRKRKPRKSKEKCLPPSTTSAITTTTTTTTTTITTSSSLEAASASFVSPTASPSLVSTLGSTAPTAADGGCNFLHPFNIALPNLSPPPLTPPSSSSPPFLHVGPSFTSIDSVCTAKAPLVASNQRILALPSPPQTAASSSSSSSQSSASAASTSNNSGQSSQETELSPWPSPSKRTQHLVNPFTGQLEPMDSSDDDDDGRLAPIREDASGPFSAVGLSPTAPVATTTSCKPRTVASSSAKKSLSSSSSSSSCSSAASTSSSPSPPAPSVSAATVVPVTTSSTLSEKIKLRLKLEPKQRIESEKKEIGRVDGCFGAGDGGASLGLQYKVDVSFVNIPTSVVSLRRGSSASALVCAPTPAVQSARSVSRSGSPSPVASPSAQPELRVPPLHISLRGRNATVVNPRREDRDSKTIRDASNSFEGDVVKPQRSRSPRNSRLEGGKTAGDTKMQALSSGRRNAAIRGGISMRRGRGSGPGTAASVSSLVQDPPNLLREKALLSGGSMFVDASDDSVTNEVAPSQIATESAKGANSLHQTAVVSSVMIPRVKSSQAKSVSSTGSRRPNSFSGLGSPLDSLGAHGLLKVSSKSESEIAKEETGVKPEGTAAAAAVAAAASVIRKTMQPEMTMAMTSTASPSSIAAPSAAVTIAGPTDTSVGQTQTCKSAPADFAEPDWASARTTAGASPLIVKGVTVGTPCFGMHVAEPVSVTSPQCQPEKVTFVSTVSKPDVKETVATANDEGDGGSSSSSLRPRESVSSDAAEARSDDLASASRDVSVKPVERRTSPFAPSPPVFVHNVCSVESNSTTVLPPPPTTTTTTKLVESVRLAADPGSAPPQRGNAQRSDDVFDSTVECELQSHPKKPASDDPEPSSCAVAVSPKAYVANDDGLAKLVCGVHLADEESENGVLPVQLTNCLADVAYSLVTNLDSRKVLEDESMESKVPRVSKVSALVASENLRIAAVVGASMIATSGSGVGVGGSGHDHGCLSDDLDDGVEGVLKQHGMLSASATAMAMTTTTTLTNSNRSSITVVSASPSSASPSGSSPDSLHIGTSSEDNGDSSASARSHGSDSRNANHHHHHHHRHHHHLHHVGFGNPLHRRRCNSSNGSPCEDSGIDSMDATTEKMSGGESPDNDGQPALQLERVSGEPCPRHDLGTDFWQEDGSGVGGDSGKCSEDPGEVPRLTVNQTQPTPAPAPTSTPTNYLTDDPPALEAGSFSKDVVLSHSQVPATMPNVTAPAAATTFLDDKAPSDAAESRLKSTNHDDAQSSDEDRIPQLESIADKESQDHGDGFSNSTNKSESNSNSNSPSPPSLEKIGPLPDCGLDASLSPVADADSNADDALDVSHVESDARQEVVVEGESPDVSSIERRASDTDSGEMARTDDVSSDVRNGPESTQLLVFTVQDVESIMVTENGGVLEISDASGTKLDLSVLKDEHVADLDEALDVYLDRHFGNSNEGDRSPDVASPLERVDDCSDSAKSSTSRDESGATSTMATEPIIEPVVTRNNQDKVEADPRTVDIVAPADSPENQDVCDDPLSYPCSGDSTKAADANANALAPAADSCDTLAPVKDTDPASSIVCDSSDSNGLMSQSVSFVPKSGQVTTPPSMARLPDAICQGKPSEHTQVNSVTTSQTPCSSSSSSSPPPPPPPPPPAVSHVRSLVTNRTWLVPNIAPFNSSSSPPPTLDPHTPSDDPPHLQSPFLDLAAAANSCGDDNDEAEPFPRLSPAFDFFDDGVGGGHDDSRSDDRDDYDSSSCESTHQREFKEDMNDLYMSNTSITSGDHNYIVRSVATSVSAAATTVRGISAAMVNDVALSNNKLVSSEVNHVRAGDGDRFNQLSVEIPSDGVSLSDRRLTRSTRSSTSRLASPNLPSLAVTTTTTTTTTAADSALTGSQLHSPSMLISDQVSPLIVVNACSATTAAAGAGATVVDDAIADAVSLVHSSLLDEEPHENDAIIMRTLPVRGTSKRKRFDDSNCESMESLTASSEPLNNDHNRTHSSRSKSPVIVEMTAHFSSKPVKRKCSENAVELIKACIGVDDNPKRAVNAKCHHPIAETLKLNASVSATGVVSNTILHKNAKSNQDVIKGTKSGCGVIGSEESSDDEVTLSELVTKTRSGRTGNARNTKMARQQQQQQQQQQQDVVGGTISKELDELTTTKGEQRTANNRGGVTNNKKEGAAGRSGSTVAVGTSRTSRQVDRIRRPDASLLSNARGHERSPQRASHRSRATTRDYVASPTRQNQSSSQEDGVISGRRKLRSNTSVSGYYDSLPQKRRRMSRDNR